VGCGRKRLLEQTIADLRAPLHPNCYLSVTQFAEKVGLHGEPTSLASHTSSNSSEQSTAQPAPHHRRSSALWLVITLALTAAVIAGLCVTGQVDIRGFLQWANGNLWQ
jgi:hypothetical protein